VDAVAAARAIAIAAKVVIRVTSPLTALLVETSMRPLRRRHPKRATAPGAASRGVDVGESVAPVPKVVT
jgi:hypothetical protein